MNRQHLTSIAVQCGSALALVLVLSTPSWAETAGLSASQVVDRNVAARGGAAAWQAIHSISFAGKMDAGKTHPAPAGTVDNFSSIPSNLSPGQRRMMLAAAPAPETTVISLPFRLEMKRPRKTRLELEFAGDTAVQIYDGHVGWKLRPFTGRTAFESFTPAETKIAESQQDLDGLLINSAANGSQIVMDGMDTVNDKKAYKLKVALRNGEVRRVWVDASTFLEVMVDGVRDVGGRSRKVTTLLSDYRRVSGVMLPFALVTRGDGLKESEKIIIDKAEVNSDLPDARFVKL